MSGRDDYGALIGLVIGLIIIVAIIYVAFIFAGVAAAAGTVYGGGTAIKNYFGSFKENVIDGNREIAAAAA